MTDNGLNKVEWSMPTTTSTDALFVDNISGKTKSLQFGISLLDKLNHPYFGHAHPGYKLQLLAACV